MRPNGSDAEFSYANGALCGYRATDAKGAVSEWVPDKPKDWEVKAGITLRRWESDQHPDDVRINLRVENSGQISYEDIPSNVIRQNTDGTTVHQNLNGTTVTLNRDDKVIELIKSDGAKVSADYSQNVLNKITTSDGTGNTTVWQPDQKQDWTAANNTAVRKQYKLTEDGIESYIESKNSQITNIQYPDGTKRFFDYNGTGLDKIKEFPQNTTWQKSATGDAWSDGTVSETRKFSNVSEDGTLTYSDAAGYKHSFNFDGTESLFKHRAGRPSQQEINAQTKLFQAADSSIKDDMQRQQFKNDISDFELRAQTQNIPQATVVRTFQELTALLKHPHQSFLEQTEREQLAREAAFHLANPRTINQNKFNTCGVATAEVLTAAKYPDRFANLIRQVADHGSYVTAQGKVIKPPKSTLQPRSRFGRFRTA